MTTVDIKRAREVADSIMSGRTDSLDEQAASLIRSLCEIVEKLPVTADGVPITPGMWLWHKDYSEAARAELTGHSPYPVRAVGGGWTMNVRGDEVHSTRESALAAAGKEKA